MRMCQTASGGCSRGPQSWPVLADKRDNYTAARRYFGRRSAAAPCESGHTVSGVAGGQGGNQDMAGGIATSSQEDPPCEASGLSDSISYSTDEVGCSPSGDGITSTGTDAFSSTS